MGGSRSGGLGRVVSSGRVSLRILLVGGGVSSSSEDVSTSASFDGWPVFVICAREYEEGDE
jgi:hypothetical protein